MVDKAVGKAHLDEASELGLEFGMGGLFIGGALNAVVAIASGNAASITSSTFFANVLTLMVTAALVGYGFMKGYRESRSA